MDRLYPSRVEKSLNLLRAVPRQSTNVLMGISDAPLGPGCEPRGVPADPPRVQPIEPACYFDSRATRRNPTWFPCMRRSPE